MFYLSFVYFSKLAHEDISLKLKLKNVDNWGNFITYPMIKWKQSVGNTRIQLNVNFPCVNKSGTTLHVIITDSERHS